MSDKLLKIALLMGGNNGKRLCDTVFRKFLKDSDPAFHWEYSPGEFIQADFAGKKLSYVDRQTGEVSCRRAANVPRPTLKLIRNILEAGLDKHPLLFDEEQDEHEEQLPDHDNIRGPENYK